MSNPPPVESHTSAAAFLEALSLERWTADESWRSPWAFRGQQRADWSLIPSAWRNHGTTSLNKLARLKEEFSRMFEQEIKERIQRNPLSAGINGDYALKAYAQARAEFLLIVEFIQLADELGHRVPEIESYLRLSHHDYLSDLHALPNVRFIPEMNAATALAQHHGVPTRSLDFTRNPLYAAYFAACEVETAKEDGFIAVWAIRLDLLIQHGKQEQYNSSFTRFIGKTVPTSDNPYLRSQQGLFVYPAYGCAHIASTGDFPSLESFAVSTQSQSDSPLLRKLTLPYSEVGSLLRLLWLKGISRAHLMPSLDNVTHALSARWKWST